MTTNLNNSVNVNSRTVLNYELTARQNAYLNYLIPSVVSFLVYVLIIASDISVVFRHFCDENHVWAWLSISFLFLPALGSYIFTISDWDLWPQNQGWSRDNIKWFFLKTFQHLFFLIWAIWRYAERIFWSIEAVRLTDPKAIEEAMSFVSAPRNVELYFFLASFLHSLPQILLQLALLIRCNEDTHHQTIESQILSCVSNLVKLSATIAYFHRFKSQKATGKQYPWFKEYKKFYKHKDTDKKNEKVQVVEVRVPKETENLLRDKTNEEEIPQSQRSSGSYLEPLGFEEPKEIESIDEVDTVRQTSIIDGPERNVYKESTDEVDFDIKRLLNVMGLPDDDVAGRLVGFFWWFTFLLARILAISAMAYFYLSVTIYMLLAHFAIVIIFLLYDVKTDDLKHSKTLFFIFLGFIYIFCIVEFKIRFKKATLIYYGFHILVYAENFAMCAVWMVRNVNDLENDFWFRYIFYIVSMCCLLGISCMIFYFLINKPKKVVVKSIVM